MNYWLVLNDVENQPIIYIQKDDSVVGLDKKDVEKLIRTLQMITKT